MLPQPPSYLLMQDPQWSNMFVAVVQLTKSTLVIAKQTIFTATYVIFLLVYSNTQNQKLKRHNYRCERLCVGIWRPVIPKTPFSHH